MTQVDERNGDTQPDDARGRFWSVMLRFLAQSQEEVALLHLSSNNLPLSAGVDFPRDKDWRAAVESHIDSIKWEDLH